LPNIASRRDIHIPHYYDFSTRFGTQRLTDELQKLIKLRAYDVLIAVDVGGDALAR
jgi:hypothetical protein